MNKKHVVAMYLDPELPTQTQSFLKEDFPNGKNFCIKHIREERQIRFAVERMHVVLFTRTVQRVESICIRCCGKDTGFEKSVHASCLFHALHHFTMHILKKGSGGTTFTGGAREVRSMSAVSEPAFQEGAWDPLPMPEVKVTFKERGKCTKVNLQKYSDIAGLIEKSCAYASVTKLTGGSEKSTIAFCAAADLQESAMTALENFITTATVNVLQVKRNELLSVLRAGINTFYVSGSPGALSCVEVACCSAHQYRVEESFELRSTCTKMYAHLVRPMEPVSSEAKASKSCACCILM